MRYELRIPRKVAKHLASVPARAREQIVRRVEQLDNWPDHGQDVKALRGRLFWNKARYCGVPTTNRNFVGRMGHSESEVCLSGPAVTAASAVAGQIASPEAIAR